MKVDDLCCNHNVLDQLREHIRDSERKILHLKVELEKLLKQIAKKDELLAKLKKWKAPPPGLFPEITDTIVMFQI